MRRFVSAAAAALALVASVLIAAPAQAAPAETAFAIGIVVDEVPPVAGDQVELASYLLTADSDPVAGRTVTVLTRTVGSGTPFKVAASVVTDADGYARTGLKMLRNTAYRWHFSGDGSYLASSSNTLVQSVQSKVVPHLSDSSPAVGQTFAVLGAAYPNKAGHRVSVWSGKYQLGFGPPAYAKMIAVGLVRADGTFRLTTKLSSKGYRTLFVRVAGDEQNLDGYSNYLGLKVG